jgi:uncharacterized UBP type Zn finger protein
MQQDAHEFYLEFVNQLSEDVRAVLQGSPPCAAAVPAPLHFEAEVAKQLTCARCGVCRDIREYFNDFSLDLCPPESPFLEQMVNSYFEPEQVSARCEACGCESATLHKRITRPPAVLALHLKRFKYTGLTGTCEKRSSPIVVPQDLDLSSVAASCCSTAKKPLHYELRAAVAHDGYYPRSGHYICYARGDSGAWHMYDDSFVQELSGDAFEEIGGHVYMLFYARQRGVAQSSASLAEESLVIIERAHGCGGA